MSKIPAKILRKLKEARQSATLEDAKFDWEDSHMNATCRSGNFEGRPDEFIKERVRVHHQTWIISRIDEVIAWAENNGTQ